MLRISKWDVAAVCLAAILSAAVLTRSTAFTAEWLAIPAATGIIVLWIAIRDATTLTISDGASISIALLGLADRLAQAAAMSGGMETVLALSALDAVLCGGALLMLREIFYRRRGFDGLGLGDVKLAFAFGILCGTVGFFWALLSASLVGIMFLLITGRHRDRLAKLPFGAFLAPACWLLWMLER